MRILIVVHGFPPHAQGGAEIYAEQHALALTRNFGDTVHVLTREQRSDNAEYAVRTEHRDGLAITWINNTFRNVSTYEESYSNPQIAHIAAGLIDAFRPDAAHIHHLTCLSTDIPRLLAARGTPVVFTLHDYWLFCHRGQLLDRNYRVCKGPEPSGCGACLGIAATPVPSRLVPGLRTIERHIPRPIASGIRGLAAHLSDATSGLQQEDSPARRRLEHMQRVCDEITRFIAPSRSIRDRFVNLGVAPERIDLSPYGFDRGCFPPAARAGDHASSRPSKGAPLRIGFLGTLMVSKAPHLLLEAFRRLPSGLATVDLFGDQADYHGDATYAKVLEPLLALPGVQARGSQPRHRIPGALASLDVLVVPSIWPETSPLVIHEAFLSGLPVVASNIGGIPELVEHERNGLLFEPGNVDALENALKRLVEEPGLLDRLKAGATGTLVRSLDEDVGAMRQRYETLVGAQQHSARVKRSRLSAVVLNFQTPADTAIAVGALMASDRPPDEVIVVDNDATPDCPAALVRWGDAVRYVRTGSNLGFAGGMNVGIRLALERGTDAVLLVNSDVVVAPDCLGKLESALASQPRVGIVGPLVLSRSSPGIVGSSGIDYNTRTGRMRQRGEGTAADLAGCRPEAEVDAVSGCLMLIARRVFDRVGLLDERYFFGFEEIDFCLRAREAGFTTRLHGPAVAYHEGGHAIGAQSPRRLYFASRNHLMLALSHGDAGNRKRRIARVLFVASLNLAHAVKAPGGSLAARLGAATRGIRDHLRGRYGADRIV